jgi:hypothetical protein
MKRALGYAVLAAMFYPALSPAKPKKLAVIDAYCTGIRDEFRETVPVAFSGPDPWVQIDNVGATLSDEALAYVYAEGPAIRWVVLLMSGAKQSWTQTVDYYFRADGTIAKRERVLESAAANIELQEVSYYLDGRVFKERTRHHTLGPGREDSSKLDDPGAPVYLSVDELPFPDTPDYLRQIAGLAERLIDVPDQVFCVLEPD